MRSEQRSSEGTELLFRSGLVLWCPQVLVLAVAAPVLMLSHAAWLDHLERVRLVRYFMANPVWMIVIEAFGTLCLLVAIS
jgi:hypothetical protein